SDGNDTFDVGTDLDLTSQGEVVQYVYDSSTYDSSRPWDVGEYSTWVSGKTFVGEDLAILESDNAIVGLDSQAQIDDLQLKLDDWLAELDATVNVAANDIIAFPTNETEFLAELGLPLDPADFPSP
ncbi:MAG: hypothetical protein ACLFP4_16445, partial [Spirochaetales bacterium]